MIQAKRIRSGARWRQIAAAVTREAAACYRCGRAISTALPVGHPSKATADHITPLALGGDPYDLGNVAAMCWKCNCSKQGRVQRQSSSW